MALRRDAVEDNEARARLARIVDVMMADDRRSWQLGSVGRWERTEVLESKAGTVDTFAVLKDDSAAAALVVVDAKAPQGIVGSMDPRA